MFWYAIALDLSSLIGINTKKFDCKFGSLKYARKTIVRQERRRSIHRCHITHSDDMDAIEDRGSIISLGA